MEPLRMTQVTKMIRIGIQNQKQTMMPRIRRRLTAGRGNGLQEQMERKQVIEGRVGRNSRRKREGLNTEKTRTRKMIRKKRGRKREGAKRGRKIMRRISEGRSERWKRRRAEWKRRNVKPRGNAKRKGRGKKGGNMKRKGRGNSTWKKRGSAKSN